MKNIKNIVLAFVILTIIITTNACQQPGVNSTGSEFVPDMAHSIAYEANVMTDYSLNRWEEEHGSQLSNRYLSQPGEPVAGTIARGAVGVAVSDSGFGDATSAVQHTMKMEAKSDNVGTPSGSVPYYYADTEEERTRATSEIIYNPYPITKDGLARGKELYNTFCAICHGEKGDGNGWLVDEKNAKAVYPAAPAILINEEFSAASNGRYYHAIMYGKNVMGGYSDKISFEERWQVIHWIRALQAKNTKVKYDENVNELNPDFGVPANSVEKMAVVEDPAEVAEADTDDAHGGDEAHDDHGHDH